MITSIIICFNFGIIPKNALFDIIFTKSEITSHAYDEPFVHITFSNLNNWNNDIISDISNQLNIIQIEDNTIMVMQEHMKFK